jgi:uncharacterized protein
VTKPEATAIKPEELRRDPLEFQVSIPEDLNYATDIRQLGPMQVHGRADLLEEHGEGGLIEDIRLRAKYKGKLEILCARCLDSIRRAVSGEFDLVFRPEGVDGEMGEHALSEAETEIGYYEKSGLMLEDVVREQVLLSLPDRSLCKPDCKGLCAVCGQNRNESDCGCETLVTDPRWNTLKDLAGSLNKAKEDRSK